MSTGAPSSVVSPAPHPRHTRRRWAFLRLVLVLALVGSAGVAAFAYRDLLLGSIPLLAAQDDRTLPSLLVDRGMIRSYLIESGSLESANNTTIYCEVEALLGTVGGPDGGSMGGRGGGGGGGSSRGSGGGSNSMSGGSSSSMGGTGGVGGTGGAGGVGGAGGTGGAGGAGGSGGAAGAGGSGAGRGSGGGGGGMGGGSQASALADRPNIRSFSYRATPHMPLASGMSMSGSSTIATLGGGGSMGGGGGGGGGRGEDQERAGSTRIIWIIDEGSRVEPGDLVCELDSSAFFDELQLQRIRHAQALSSVVQAETILQVAEIELQEYRDGIYPQDVTLVEQYLANCRTKQQESELTYEWSLDLNRKGLNSDSQLLGDRLLLEQWQIELENAREMQRRLIDYTGRRIITSLEAKVEAVKADLLSQKAAFQVEDDRLKRLERAIANCKLYAPARGVVVYARNTNSWGRVEDEIAEGSTVRENQAVIQLPDPDNMQILVKINESKINSVREGMETTIRIDAFPDRPLRGVVKEIKPIPVPANIVSDVKLYNATVLIIGGFEGLRPGLSAEVAFHLGERSEVTRVPLQAIRWVEETPFAAISARDGSVTWKRLDVGLMNPVYAEIEGGLEPGDRIVADPLALPAPDLAARQAEGRIALATPAGR